MSEGVGQSAFDVRRQAVVAVQRDILLLERQIPSIFPEAPEAALAELQPEVPEGQVYLSEPTKQDGLCGFPQQAGLVEIADDGFDSIANCDPGKLLNLFHGVVGFVRRSGRLVCLNPGSKEDAQMEQIEPGEQVDEGQIQVVVRIVQ
jgi:hypothetical protein